MKRLLSLTALLFFALFLFAQTPKPSDQTFTNVWVKNNLIVGIPPNQITFSPSMFSIYLRKADTTGNKGYLSRYGASILYQPIGNYVTGTPWTAMGYVTGTPWTSMGYLTYETSHADVVVDGDFPSEGIMKRNASSGTYSILTDNSSNWNTAYSWGNHASAGYDASTTNEIQNLSYTASTKALAISGGTGVTFPNFATNATTPGMVPGSNNLTTRVLKGDGTWSTTDLNFIASTRQLSISTGNSFAFPLFRTDQTWGGLCPGSANTGPTCFLNGSASWTVPKGTQALTYTASTGNLSIENANNITIPSFSTTTSNPGLVPGSSSVGSSYFLNAAGSWSIPPSGGSYTAGFGISIASNAINNVRYWKNQDSVKTTLIGILTASSGLLSSITDNSSNWNTAFSWGNHASSGYVTATGNTDNRVATMNGTGVTGEPNLTFDGSDLTVTGRISSTANSTTVPTVTFINTATYGSPAIRLEGDLIIKQYPSDYSTTIRANNPNSDYTLMLPENLPSVNGYVLAGLTSGVTYWTPQSSMSMVYPGSGIPTSTGSAWGSSIVDNSSNWNTAFSWGNHALAGYDPSTSNEIQSLSYSASTRAVGISGSTGFNLPLFSTSSTDAGLVPGNTGYGSTYFLNANGTWAVPSGSGSMIYPASGLAVSTGTAWGTSITDNSSNWNTAYSWGNHASAGYVTGTPWTSMGYVTGTPWTAMGYLTSQTSHADVVIDGDFISEGLMRRNGTSGSYTIVTDNSSNWNTAYSWGNHASAGYDASTTNEIQNLSYTASTKALAISGGTGTTLPLFSTTTTDPGLVPGNSALGSTYFLNANGAWAIPAGGSGMTYPAAGIAYSTGSAWGTSYSTSGTGSVLALTASPTFTGTVVIPSPFTLGGTSMTTTAAKLNYLTSATGTTGTTSTNIVFSASPTFTGTVSIPSPFTLGGTSMTTTAAKLNYLTSATGTTGTTTTNIVFSASPTFTGSPVLSTATATSISTPSIITASNADLTITPNGTGQVTITDIKTATFNAMTANTSSAGAVTINWNSSNIQTHALSENTTFTFTAPPGVATLNLKIVHSNNTTAHTTTFPASVKWTTGVAYSATQTANAVDAITFIYDGTNYLATPIYDFK